MFNKTPSNLKGSLFFSLFLHLVVLAILIWGAFNYTTPLSGESKNSIQAIMVDPDIMLEQRRRQMQQQVAIKKREETRRQQALEKAKFVEKQKIIEQTRLKRIERERLASLKKQQTAAAAAKKAAEEKKHALAEAAKAKALLQEQQKQLLEKTKKIEMDIRKQKEQDKALNDVLGELTAIDRSAKTGAKQVELDRYTSLVHHAITNKFINSDLYHGKSCVLKLSLARDGLLLSVSSQGDQTLCFAAESATRLAIFPRPESEGVYEKVKNFTIDFKPQKAE